MFTARSERFATMLAGPFAESSSATGTTTVIIDHVDPATFAALKKYVNAAILPDEPCHLVALFAVAEMYVMYDCCRAIQRQLYHMARADVHFAFAVFCNIDEGEKGLEAIREMALRSVCPGSEAVLESEAWLDASAPDVAAVLRSPLAATEEQLLQAARRWLDSRNITVGKKRSRAGQSLDAGGRPALHSGGEQADAARASSMKCCRLSQPRACPWTPSYASPNPLFSAQALV